MFSGQLAVDEVSKYKTIKYTHKFDAASNDLKQE